MGKWHKVQNRTLTLGETAAEFHAKTHCSPVHAVGQNSDLAGVNWRHQTVADHGRRVAVPAQDLQTEVTCHNSPVRKTTSAVPNH
jgi:hypothetical protein